MNVEKSIILIGYSGHAFVVADTLNMLGHKLVGYMDFKETTINPYNLTYLGKEDNNETLLRDNYFITAIGDNHIRNKITEKLINKGFRTVSAIHPSAIIASNVTIGEMAMIFARSVINPVVKIGNGVIINTGAIIEHECIVDDYAHIGPGAVLAGNVKIGNNSFIGANAVIKQGVKIGKNVIIGAGAVVLYNVADHTVVVGNPGRNLLKEKSNK